MSLREAKTGGGDNLEIRLSSGGKGLSCSCEFSAGLPEDYLLLEPSQKKMIRSVAIVGTGAVGSYYGCRISNEGYEVRFLLRSDFEAVSERGFEIESYQGDFALRDPQIYQNSEEIGPVDLVLVCWKATANPHAAEVISPLLHEKTRILTLQNGLGNVEHLDGLFGADRVLGGLCLVCLNRLEPGKIRHQRNVKDGITIGELGKSEVLAELSSVFGPFVQIGTTDNLALAQWRKLFWNVPFNGFCITEGGVDTEELLKLPGMKQRIEDLLVELQQGAKACGFSIADKFVFQQVPFTESLGAYHPSSLLDYLQGNSVEYEAIWGEPLRRCEAAGAEMPLLNALCAKLQSSLE